MWTKARDVQGTRPSGSYHMCKERDFIKACTDNAMDSKYYYIHLTDGESEAQTGEVTLWRSHSNSVADRRLESRTPNSWSCILLNHQTQSWKCFVQGSPTESQQRLGKENVQWSFSCQKNSPASCITYRHRLHVENHKVQCHGHDNCPQQPEVEPWWHPQQWLVFRHTVRVRG